MAPLLLVTMAAAGVRTTTPRPLMPPQGHVAAWLYDDRPKKHQPAPPPSSVAMWSSAIAAFNGGATRPINVAYSYAGDMEYYPDGPQTYFPASAVAAAAKYAQSTNGVEYVVAVVDGRMDGGHSFSPDLSKRTQAEVEAWANSTAQIVCASANVDGIQIDLEPVAPPYATRLVQFLAQLSKALRSDEQGCVTAMHPQGRSVSAFMMAPAATAAVWEALGPNGYVTVSGYDLSEAPAGTPSTVAEYGTRLGAVVDAITASAQRHNGSFVLGIPAAASCHEFELFTPSNGSAVHGHTQLEYLQQVRTTTRTPTLRASLPPRGGAPGWSVPPRGRGPLAWTLGLLTARARRGSQPRRCSRHGRKPPAVPHHWLRAGFQDHRGQGAACKPGLSGRGTLGLRVKNGVSSAFREQLQPVDAVCEREGGGIFEGELCPSIVCNFQFEPRVGVCTAAVRYYGMPGSAC